MLWGGGRELNRKIIPIPRIKLSQILFQIKKVTTAPIRTRKAVLGKIGLWGKDLSEKQGVKQTLSYKGQIWVLD